jgi:hypothetical protein
LLGKQALTFSGTPEAADEPPKIQGAAVRKL